MTVSNTTSVVQYNGNGATVAWPTGFRFFNNTDLVVTKRSVAGVTTLLTLNTDYSVSGANALTGGTVTTTNPLATGELLTVARVLTVQQLTDLRNQGNYFAEIHEDVFDYLTMLIQQTGESDSRALRHPRDSEHYQAEARRIVDLEDPVSDQDAATRGWATRYFGNLIDSVTGLINTTMGIIYDGMTLYDYLKSGVPRNVASIAALRLLSGSRNQLAQTLSYYGDFKGGRSLYRANPANTTSPDDGVMVIVGADGMRWELVHDDWITAKQAGVRENGVADDLAAWVRAIATGLEIRFWNLSLVSNVVTLDNYTTIKGMTKRAVIKAMDGVDFEYVVRGVSKTGVRLEDFTADANRQGRSAQLTTRTIAVGVESGTDCLIRGVTGLNAIGKNSIPGVGISTGGGGDRVDVMHCQAIDCGITGQAADGFFSSSSNSLNIGNRAIRCLDTGHVLESCSNSGIVGAISVDCGVWAAVTNARAADSVGNFISGISGRNFNAGVTGGIQIGAFGTGNLIGTSVTGFNVIGDTTAIGPAINVRETNTGRVDGLTLNGRIVNASTQGILVSGKNVNITASISGVTNACIQYQGDSTGTVFGSDLRGGSYGVAAAGTANIKVSANSCSSQSWGIYAFGTSTITSAFNAVTSPGTGYEGKDAGATLNRASLIGSDLSLGNFVATAPTGTLNGKYRVLNASGGGVGWIPTYTA